MTFPLSFPVPYNHCFRYTLQIRFESAPSLMVVKTDHSVLLLLRKVQLVAGSHCPDKHLVCMPPSVMNSRERPSLTYLWEFTARHPIEIQGRCSQAPRFCLALRGGTRKIEGNTGMDDAGISEVPQEQEMDLVSFLLTE